MAQPAPDVAAMEASPPRIHRREVRKPVIKMHDFENTDPTAHTAIIEGPSPPEKLVGTQIRVSSPIDSHAESKQSDSPDSPSIRKAYSNMSLNGRSHSGGAGSPQQRSASRQSFQTTASQPLLDDLTEDKLVHSESAPGLQYFHQPSSDPNYAQGGASSRGHGDASPVSSTAEYPQGQLQLPYAGIPRPNSTQSLGSNHSGHYDDAQSGSPRTYSRNLAPSRRTGDARPTSYIDLLLEVPYSQQVAPSPALNNNALKLAVGNNASLLDTKKTLDMYRANVKKTNDPAIQYEFAIFMINMAGEAIANGQSTGSSETATDLIKEARNILQRLADRGYPFAQYYLADGYFSGFFSKEKPDFEKAYALFLAASKHGHAEAGYRTALCYEAGWGTAKSLPKAVQFYRTAASKGHPGAAVRLGMACLMGNMGLIDKYGEGVKWLKRAQESADTQYNSGPYELGVLHTTGFGKDIFKDEAYAAQLLTQSAELGHVEANYKMGQAYELGLLGCPRDPALSVHFYNGAAQKGSAEAMMALCAWYMVGAEPVLEKDEAEAYAWAHKAAELGMWRIRSATCRALLT